MGSLHIFPEMCRAFSNRSGNLFYIKNYQNAYSFHIIYFSKQNTNSFFKLWACFLKIEKHSRLFEKFILEFRLVPDSLNLLEKTIIKKNTQHKYDFQSFRKVFRLKTIGISGNLFIISSAFGLLANLPDYLKAARSLKKNPMDILISLLQTFINIIYKA